MTRRPVCASATAARRIGINNPCQSPPDAIACAISGALSVPEPARIRTSRMESSRGMACGESWADMHHAMAHLDALVHPTTITPLRSFDPQIGVVNDLAPLFQLQLDARCKLVGRIGDWFEAE